MRVHLVETVGEGGIYQHTLAVAALLQEAGIDVTLHTAGKREIEPPPGIEVCECLKWFNKLPRGAVRKVLIGASYTLWTVPHLVSRIRRGDVAHYQGHILLPVTATLLWLLRLRGARVVHSPHNTFNRVDLPFDDFALRMCARAAAKNIVFSSYDERRIVAAGGEVLGSPLVQLLPKVESEAQLEWRRQWSANGKPIALFAGQLREDKCLKDLLRAAATSQSVKVAVVGDDKGEAKSGRELAEELSLDVSWSVGYFSLDDFVAAIAAADVVVCPYRQASQSGVLSIARQLGVPTVASDVGGLAELADATFPHGDREALALAIDEALAVADPAKAARGYEEAARSAHLAAYGIAADGTPPSHHGAGVTARDAVRTTRLVFANEIAEGRVSQSDLEHPDVVSRVAPAPIPPRPVRFAQRLAQKAGRLDYFGTCVAPALEARAAVLGAEAGGAPRLLVRVDEFPHHQALAYGDRYGSDAFRRFHSIMTGAGVQYLAAIIPRVSHDPLEPRCAGGRGLDGDEREVIAQLREDGVSFGLHGYNHRTRLQSPQQRSEISGLSAPELHELLDRAHAELAAVDVDPRVFVPPFNRFDATQYDVLAERYDVICGGPESVPLVGLQRTPQWRGEAVFMPSYPPLYARASAVLPEVDALIDRGAAVWAPITLHWAWESDEGWFALERLAERIAPYTASWDDFLGAVEASR